MKKREIDILIGTQMITKGHDYPHVTLVGILDADSILHFPDFRSSERTYQMITQVSGRAGRGERPGHVLVQTYEPQRLQELASHGDDFYQKELSSRKDAGYPPYVRLIEIRLSSLHRESVIEKSRMLLKEIRKKIPSGVLFLGPAPCVIEKVRRKTRWRFLMKTTQYTKIQVPLQKILENFDLPSTMKMLVNVDPVDMM